MKACLASVASIYIGRMFNEIQGTFLIEPHGMYAC